MAAVHSPSGVSVNYVISALVRVGGPLRLTGGTQRRVRQISYLSSRPSRLSRATVPVTHRAHQSIIISVSLSDSDGSTLRLSKADKPFKASGPPTSVQLERSTVSGRRGRLGTSESPEPARPTVAKPACAGPAGTLRLPLHWQVTSRRRRALDSRAPLAVTEAGIPSGLRARSPFPRSCALVCASVCVY